MIYLVTPPTLKIRVQCCPQPLIFAPKGFSGHWTIECAAIGVDWKVVVAGIAAVGIICGALGYKIGATPPAPIIIQIPR